ncbi:hypothetical protein K488DRAFT_74880, partial [Vararia minispora EC-137]
STGAGSGKSVANGAGGDRASEEPACQRLDAGSSSMGSRAPVTVVDGSGQVQACQGKCGRRASAAATASDGEGDADRGKRKRLRTAKGERWQEAINARDARHEACVPSHTRGGSRGGGGQGGGGHGRGRGGGRRRGRGRGRGCGTGNSK